jgi:CHAT domain
VAVVVAMRHSILVTTAKLFMGSFYEGLFAGKSVAAAARNARACLYNDKSRKAHFNQTIDVEDWLVPAVYE